MIEEKDLSINEMIKAHGTAVEDWPLQKLSVFLYQWADLFNRVFFEGKLATPVISFQKTNHKMLGHFVPGRNHLGLMWNININVVHLKRPICWVLCTLLHEQLHEWQQEFGKPSGNNYHNKEFREKSRALGIPSNDRGMTLELIPPFTTLLDDSGITIEPETAKEPPKIGPGKGKSTLQKWSCGCTNIRVGKRDFSATCNLCGNTFEPV